MQLFLSLNFCDLFCTICFIHSVEKISPCYQCVIRVLAGRQLYIKCLSCLSSFLLGCVFVLPVPCATDLPLFVYFFVVCLFCQPEVT
jgi:hypothetical protein